MDLLMIGASIALFGFIVGCAIVMIVGTYFVKNFVTKISPEELREIYQKEDEEQSVFKPVEESLWARGIWKSDLDNFYKEVDNDG